METNINYISIFTKSADERHGNSYEESPQIFNNKRIKELCACGNSFSVILNYPSPYDGNRSIMEFVINNNSVDIKHKRYNTTNGFDECKTVTIGDKASFNDVLFIYDMSAYYSVTVK